MLIQIFFIVRYCQSTCISWCWLQLCDKLCNEGFVTWTSVKRSNVHGGHGVFKQSLHTKQSYNIHKQQMKLISLKSLKYITRATDHENTTFTKILLCEVQRASHTAKCRLMIILCHGLFLFLNLWQPLSTAPMWADFLLVIFSRSAVARPKNKSSPDTSTPSLNGVFGTLEGTQKTTKLR